MMSAIILSVARTNIIAILRQGRLSTIDLLIKITCYVKKLNNNCNIKGPDLNQLVQGGQPY